MSDLDRLLDLGSGNAALLYLYRRKYGKEIEPYQAMQRLKFSEAALKTAFIELVGAGLADAGELPHFGASGNEAAAAALQEPENGFARLLEEFQRRLGKIFSYNDLNALQQLYYQLALPDDVMLLLLEYCVREVTYKYGAGRKPTMAQIRREGSYWVEMGIDTAAAAEEYIDARVKKRSVYERLLPKLGIVGRAPIKREQEYLDRWVAWGFPDEVILLAYERTLFKKQSFDWAYCNGILRSWEKKKLRSVAAVEEFELPKTQHSVEEDISWMREFVTPDGQGKK